MDFVSTWVRLAVGMTVMALGVIVWAFLMFALLPFGRAARARGCNYFGKTVLRGMVWLSGCPVTVRGREHLDPARPAIYISNHTSIMDIFLTAWLTPVGTCAVAKKQVVWYPFFGQLYLLSGHFRIDRSTTERAILSMRKIGDLARAHGHSIMIWPEGTRSRDGRMLPFKKGIVHLAVATGLPIVPIAIAGAHRSWEAKSMRLARVPIDITVLPAVDTSSWTIEDADALAASLQQPFLAALPADQLPVPTRAAA
jgi:lysophosphatidate acyltransferase